MKAKQSRRLVKTASPVHQIISQVLFCIEQNCLDIIVVYEIVMTFVPIINLCSIHWVQYFSFSTNLHVFPCYKINLAPEGIY